MEHLYANSVDQHFINLTVNSIQNVAGQVLMRYKTAILAGGCFWGVEYYLQKHEGVKSVISGYIGGHIKDPSYKEVCIGKTGHAEAVKVIYDPEKISYEEVLEEGV